MKIESDTLQRGLQQFTGTEQWYRNPLYRMTYSDGVKYFAEQAAAYWFIDICGTELARLQAKDPFLLVKLTSAENKAVIVVEDGNENVIRIKEIDFTDCPAGEWKFYLTNNVLHLPTEY